MVLSLVSNRCAKCLMIHRPVFRTTMIWSRRRSFACGMMDSAFLEGFLGIRCLKYLFPADLADLADKRTQIPRTIVNQKKSAGILSARSARSAGNELDRTFDPRDLRDPRE